MLNVHLVPAGRKLCYPATSGRGYDVGVKGGSTRRHEITKSTKTYLGLTA
jgi:hypothetical protein